MVAVVVLVVAVAIVVLIAAVVVHCVLDSEVERYRQEFGSSFMHKC